MQVVASRKSGTADGIAPMHQLRPYLFSGLVALCATFAVVAGSDAVRVLHSYFRLLSSGVAAEARVLQTYWVKSGSTRVYPIPHASYSFPTRQGTVQRGEGRITRAQSEQLRAGSSITVIFEPAYPANSAPNLAEMLSNAPWSMGGVIVAALVGIVFAREWRRRHQALNTTK